MIRSAAGHLDFQGCTLAAFIIKHLCRRAIGLGRTAGEHQSLICPRFGLDRSNKGVGFYIAIDLQGYTGVLGTYPNKSFLFIYEQTVPATVPLADQQSPGILPKADAPIGVAVKVIFK